MDKIRRRIFTISAEGATLFEWAIWASLITSVFATPAVITILDSPMGIFIVLAAIFTLFALTYILLSITDKLLECWPYEISEEELEFERNYVPMIPDD